MLRGQYFLHEQVASELSSVEPSSEVSSSGCIRYRLLDHVDFDDLILTEFFLSGLRVGGKLCMLMWRVRAGSEETFL